MLYGVSSLHSAGLDTRLDKDMLYKSFLKRYSDKLGISTDQLGQTVSYCVAFVLLGASDSILGPSLPGLARQTGSTLQEISLLFIARSVGSMFTSAFLGTLFDTRNGHKLMNFAMFLLSLTLLLTPVVPQLYALTIIVLLSGVGTSLLNVGGNMLIVFVHGAKVPPYMVALHFAYSVGAFLAPLLIAASVSITGKFDLAYWFMGILMFIPMLLCHFTPAPEIIKSGDQDSQPVKLTGPLALFITFFFLYVCIEAGLTGWIYTYAIEMNLADEITAAYLVSTLWGMETIGRFFSIPLAARYKPMHMVITCVTGATISITLMYLFPTTSAAIWTGMALLGLSLSSLFASMLAVARAKTQLTGKTTGWLFVGAQFGGMTLPWLVGQYFESYGPLFLMHSLMVSQLLMVAVVWAIWRLPNLHTTHD